MGQSRQVNDIAQALIVASHEAKATSEIVENLSDLNSAFKQNPELLASLRERSIPIEKRAEVLKTALKKETHIYVLNALLSLQHANLLDEFESFYINVLRFAQEIANHFEVKVTSALPLQASEKKGLEGAITKRFDGSHRVHEHIDPGILGGLIIEIGDWRFDASVKGKIEKLRESMRGKDSES